MHMAHILPLYNLYLNIYVLFKQVFQRYKNPYRLLNNIYHNSGLGELQGLKSLKYNTPDL